MNVVPPGLRGTTTGLVVTLARRGPGGPICGHEDESDGAAGLRETQREGGRGDACETQHGERPRAQTAMENGGQIQVKRGIKGNNCLI